jgi:tetratricopeptide (TPR) repeat protein
MKARSARRRWAAAGTLAALFLISCGPSSKPGLEPDLARAEHYLAVGDFQGALESYSSIVEISPDDRTARSEFADAVEQIKARADLWLKEKDFSSAERTYSLLLGYFPRFKSLEKSLSFGPETLSRRIEECLEHLSERRAREYLAEGDILKALDGFKGLPQDALRSPAQAAGLRRIMEEIRTLAEKAVARRDFVTAGKGYAVLWREYALAGQARISLSFTQNDAEKGLKECRAQLTREGLDQYRKGNLREAIAIWNGLLAFDPDNAEIKKAVDTATEQLKKLQKR